MLSLYEQLWKNIKDAHKTYVLKETNLQLRKANWIKFIQHKNWWWRMNLGTLGLAIRVIVMLLIILFVALGVSGKLKKWLKRNLKGEKTEEEW